MLRRFDNEGNWIEDMKSNWPVASYDMSSEDHKGMLVVWSFYEHEVLKFNVDRSNGLSGICAHYDITATGSGGANWV